MVEVSNGGGSVTSDPATLTITTAIYVETFGTNEVPITSIGWAADANNGAYGHITASSAGSGMGIWAAGPSAGPEAFYTSTALNNGSITGQMAFPLIRLADVPVMTFYVDNQSWWHPELIHTYFAVQMNFRQWYVSATEVTQAGGNAVTQTMTFDPTASAWNQLTVSGAGCTNSASMPLIGSAATADLAGYITGAGIVNVYDGGSWIAMDNFKIVGDGFIAHPVPDLKITPSGSDVILTWAYGTLVESTSLTVRGRR